MTKGVKTPKVHVEGKKEGAHEVETLAPQLDPKPRSLSRRVMGFVSFFASSACISALAQQAEQSEKLKAYGDVLEELINSGKQAAECQKISQGIIRRYNNANIGNQINPLTIPPGPPTEKSLTELIKEFMRDADEWNPEDSDPPIHIVQQARQIEQAVREQPFRLLQKMEAMYAPPGTFTQSVYESPEIREAENQHLTPVVQKYMEDRFQPATYPLKFELFHKGNLMGIKFTLKREIKLWMEGDFENRRPPKAKITAETDQVWTLYPSGKIEKEVTDTRVAPPVQINSLPPDVVSDHFGEIESFLPAEIQQELEAKQQKLNDLPIEQKLNILRTVIQNTPDPKGDIRGTIQQAFARRDEIAPGVNLQQLEVIILEKIIRGNKLIQAWQSFSLDEQSELRQGLEEENHLIEMGTKMGRDLREHNQFRALIDKFKAKVIGDPK